MSRDQNELFPLLPGKSMAQSGVTPSHFTNRYKTIICKHYEKLGMCPLGAKCHFAHGLGELRTIADPLPPQALEHGNSSHIYGKQSPSTSYSNYKTVKCKNFEREGNCKYGGNCTFAHGDFEMRKPTDPTPLSVEMEMYQNIMNSHSMPNQFHQPYPTAVPAAPGGYSLFGGMKDAIVGEKIKEASSLLEKNDFQSARQVIDELVKLGNIQAAYPPNVVQNLLMTQQLQHQQAVAQQAHLQTQDALQAQAQAQAQVSQMTQSLLTQTGGVQSTQPISSDDSHLQPQGLPVQMPPYSGSLTPLQLQRIQQMQQYNQLSQPQYMNGLSPMHVKSDYQINPLAQINPLMPQLGLPMTPPLSQYTQLSQLRQLEQLGQMGIPSLVHSPALTHPYPTFLPPPAPPIHTHSTNTNNTSITPIQSIINAYNPVSSLQTNHNSNTNNNIPLFPHQPLSASNIDLPLPLNPNPNASSNSNGRAASQISGVEDSVGIQSINSPLPPPGFTEINQLNILSNQISSQTSPNSLQTDPTEN
jgi:hypothetical protein